MKNPIISHITRAVLLLNLLLVLPSAARYYSPQPDLMLPGAIAALKVDEQASRTYKETYNLGATGLRGWIYINSDNAGTEGLMTAKSRQILITVAEAPGSAVLAVDDLIIGAMAASSGEVPLFNSDCRKALGVAIGDAEKTGAGTLRVKRWRAGVITDVNIAMTIMGNYTATGPYSCPKSAAILANARTKFVSQLLADPNFLSKNYGGAIDALALLASVAPGDANYAAVQTRLQTYARSLTPADLTLNGCATWDWSYIGIFLSEYYLRSVADGVPDTSVLSGINKYTVALAKGQGKYGTYGHGGAEEQADGSLHGSIPAYGPVNAAGIPANIAILMGRKVLESTGGAVDPEINPAIVRGSNFFAYYVNKGLIPYGEHEPISDSHASNGKDQMCAVLFGLQASRTMETEYFARMSVAGCTAREAGHTGQGLSYLWGAMGANMGGQTAIAKYMENFRWHSDLVRRTDGSFTYHGQEQYGGGKTADGTYLGATGYSDVSPTASYLLSYSVSLQRLYITGRNAIPANNLSAAKVANAIAAATFKQNVSSFTVTQLMAALSEYDPVVRRDVATELAKRPLTTEVDTLIALITNGTMSSDPNVRMTASQTLGLRKTTGALAALTQRLSDSDLWVRGQAANALKNYGAAANPQLNPMLTAFTTNATDPNVIVWSDPIQIANGYLAETLFSNLSGSTVNAAKNLLYPAVQAGLKQPDGMARGYLAGFVENRLTFADVQMLAPHIIQSAAERSPADRMFSDDIRAAAIKTLAKFKIEEAIPLCLQYKEQTWHSEEWFPFDILQNTYRGAAKDVLPTLYKWQAHLPLFAADSSIRLPDGRLAGLTSKLASTIAAIEKDNAPPTLTYFKSLTATATPAAVAFPAAITTLGATMTDIDGGTQNVIWSKLSGPGAVSFSPSSLTANSNGSASFSLPGTYVLRARSVDRSILDYNRWITYSSGFFDFKTYDEILGAATKDVTVTVSPDPNRAAVSQNQNLITALNTTVPVTLAATDADGDTLTYTVVASPLHGALSGTPPNLVFTPTTGYTGLDSFTFKASDGKVDSGVATVTLAIGMAGNRSPVAANQAVTTLEETAKFITLAGTDADGNPLTYSLVTMPTRGILTGTAPNLTYLPAGNYPADNFNGTDSFTFTVRDAALTSAVAVVNITVTPVNDSPQAIAQAVNASVGVANPITLSGTDAEVYPLSYTVGNYPTHGIISGVAPNLIYRATANYHGPDSFTFKAVDSEGALSPSVTVNITVTNDPPVAVSQVVKTQPNTSVAVILTGNDSTNDTLSLNVLTQPASGSLSGTAPNLTYTPASGFTGTDSFTFRANDGTLNSASATVTIRVAQVQTWTNITSGNWSTAANWNGGVTPTAGGSNAGTLEFNTGAYSGISSNDLVGTFLLNRMNFGSALPAMFVSGNNLSFAPNATTLPEINQDSAKSVVLSNNLSLAAGTTIGGSGAGSLTLSGIISGTSSLTQASSGNLTLTGLNTYSGGTVVSRGTFTIGNKNGCGTGVITLAAGSTFQQANFEGNSSDLAFPNLIVLSGIGKVDLNMPFAYKDIWLSQVVSGSGGLAVQGGARVLTLTGSNTFSGGITIKDYSNRIVISNFNALGTGTFRSETTTATSGRLETASALASGSGVANAFDIANHAYLNLYVNGSNHLLLSGPIASTGGTGHLHKYGSATLTLSGVNTYSGTTTVAAGILACNSASSLASGALAITGTAKLNLNFTGPTQISSLSLGGVVQANGTYGSTSSSAANKNDTWFSGTGMVTVASTTTTTALGLTAGSSPSYSGASQTFTATVNGSTPTGNVSFYDGAALLSTRALNSTFQASFTTSLTLGSHSITAQYAGDTNNRISTSPVLTTQINAAPAPPLGLVATPGANRISLTWAAVSQATDYRVKRSLTSGGPYVTINVSYGAAYIDTSAVDGTTYYYVVSASNGSGESANSSSASAKPYTPSSAKNIQTFVFPGLPAATISGTNISANVPFGTNVSALAPTYAISALAVGSPISGTARDFTTPKTYTITAEDFSTQTYSVTVIVNQRPIAAGQSLVLGINTAKPITLAATDTNGDTLTYTIVSSPVNGNLSGTPPNVIYTPSSGYSGTDSFTFKANDGAIDSVTATVSISVTPLDFTWNTAIPGNWNDGSKWTVGTSPSSIGLESYVLNFNATGTYIATHNLSTGFLLNRLNFGGSTATLAGNSLAFSANGSTLPQVNQNSASAVTISTNLALTANTTLGGSGAGALTLSGIISGGGTLIKTTSGNLTLSGVNTYTAGTRVSSGTITLANRNGLGTGSLTLAAGTTFQQSNFEGNSTDGAVPNVLVLSGTGNVIVNMPFGQKDVWLSQPVSGTGGFTVQGGGRSLTLTGNNTFSGGIKLTNSDNKIQIAHVNALGTGTFRSERLTANSGHIVSFADLSPGAGVINAFDIAPGAYLNVLAEGTNNLKFSGSITNAVGVGNLYKSGSATLILSGVNTYTGATTVAAGILACNAATSLGQGPVIITSGKLSLNYTGTRQVTSLSLGGGAQANGTYGSTASSATNKNDTYFSGNGTVTVGPVNSSPVASAQSANTVEDMPKGITLAATDANLDALTYTIVTLPTHGLISGTGSNVTYTPAANYNGADSFTFKANDGTSDSAVATVTITVTAVNDVPVAVAQNVSTAEGIAKAIMLVGTDVEAGALNYIIVTQPVNGVLSGNTPNVTYTPSGSYNGTDSFTFKVNDGTIDSDVAQVSITVTSASFIWNSAISGNWSDSTKWAAGVGLGNSGLASYIFNFNPIGTYTSTNDLSSGLLLNRINFNGSNSTLAGNSLSLVVNGSTLPQVNQNSANSATIAANLVLNANTSLGGSGAGALTLSGIISGGSRLTKGTGGNLTLSGLNTYSGGTLVNNGTLTLAHRNGLGTGAVTMAVGTTFQQSIFEGNSSDGALPNALVLSGTGNVIMNTSFGGGSKDVWLSQLVSGSGGLTVQGGGRSLTLTGNNTFSGGVKLTNADNKIQIAHPNALGTGVFRSERTAAATGSLVTFENLSVAPGVPNAFDIASEAYLNVFADGSNHLLLSGPITSAVGIGHLHKSGTAMLTLSGANTYTGTTTVAAGTLACNTATALGQGPVAITSGAKLSLNFTGTRKVTSLSLGGVAQADGSYGSTASPATNKNDTYFTGVGTISIGGDFTWNSAVAGNWSDITKWSSGSSPSTAGLDIYVLNFNATGIYTSTHDLSAGFLVNKLNFGGSIATLAGNGLTLSANSSSLPNINQNSGNEVIVSTNLALAANTTLGGIGGGGLTLSGIISGGSNLTKITSGNLTLSGLNTYSGGTVVSGGTLTLAHRNGLGTGAATLAAGSTFQQSTFEGNSSGGALPNALVLSSNGNVIMNMPFGWKDVWLSQPVSGSGGLTVQGGGRALTLTGNNTFSGGIRLTNSDNRIQIAHLSALGTGIFRSERTTAANGGLVSFANLSTAPGVTNAVNIVSGAYLNVFADGINHLLLSGPISSAIGIGHLHKSGSATLTLSGVNAYTGTTTVAGGMLACNSATSLGQGPIIITSGKLSLNYTGTRQVTSLSLGGVAQANGTYGSTSSPATNKNNTYFNGVGTITVGPVSADTAGTTTVASNLNPAKVGAAVTLMAAVTGDMPTGSVSFYNGATLLGTSVLNGSSTASITTSSLAAGSNRITATYLGDGTNPTSTSAELIQGVLLAGYEIWVTNSTQGLTVGVNDSSSADPDGDGISNLVEFALGGAPMVSSATIFPTFSQPSVDWVFEYNRSDAAQDSTIQVVEYGSDLSGWISVPIPATSTGIVEITPGSPSDRVKVTIPNQGPQNFVRLKVSQ